MKTAHHFFITICAAGGSGGMEVNMKICIAVAEFPKLSETFVVEHIVSLIDSGHDVSIIAYNECKEKKEHELVEKYKLRQRTIYLNIPNSYYKRIQHVFTNFICNAAERKLIVHTLNLFLYGKSILSLRLYYIIRNMLNQQYDIIHCHFGNVGKYYSYIKEISKSKLVITFHGNDVSKIIKKKGKNYYKNVFKNADKILPVSNFWALKLKSLGCPEDKIYVHHMGIDIDRYEFKRRIVIGEYFKLLTVGRLVEKKGIEYSIKAVARLIDKGYKIIYTIVGQGPLYNTLQNLIYELKMDKYIFLVGDKSPEEVKELLYNNHIFILASVTAQDGDQEGIPVSLMEAMCSGMIVISTYHSGIPELVNGCGFLVYERNSDQLAHSIEHVIQTYKNWSNVTIKAREKVEKEFNKNLLNTQLEQIYEDIVKFKSTNFE